MKSVSIEPSLRHTTTRIGRTAMSPSSKSASFPAADPAQETATRLDFLDATRAFALLLGIVFHAAMSFMPVFIGWAVQDVSTSPLVSTFVAVSHAFRMETFFLLAGFFSQFTVHRRGAAEFVRSRLVRILVPFVVGWFLLRPLLVSGWIMGNASLRGDVDIRAGLLGGIQSLSTLPTGIFTGSHLWFLYYLAMVTALTLAGRRLLAASGSLGNALRRLGDAIVAWLAASPFSPLFLAIPTAAALGFMHSWGMDTPDKSLRPHLPALAIYGGFFVFGWMLGRQRERIIALARLTPMRLILAGIGAITILTLGRIEGDPAHRHYVVIHVAYSLGYALTMWSLVFLTLGLFRIVCRRSNPAVRYVADSSYWMYLIHLPIVVWLQVAVAELPLHWSLKLAIISGATIAIGLLSYDLIVRSTFIGHVLNGRRRQRMLSFQRPCKPPTPTLGPLSRNSVTD
jgi:peptidoglycan/LPS O-acetylase OafA/YrhL